MMDEPRMRTILLTIVGTLVMVISGWAGNRISDHESRLNKLEITYAEVSVLLKTMTRTNSIEHEKIIKRLDRFEDRMNEALK